MGIISDLSDAVLPHADKLNKTIATGVMAIHGQLDRIHQATLDLQKPDVGDEWFRINFKKKLETGESFEFYEVPPNQICRVQWACADGVQEKSPACILTIDQASMIFSIQKEFAGTETPGGDIVVMPGESLFITAREAGNFSLTIGMVRRRIPTFQSNDMTGEPGGLLTGTNLHEPGRDLIESATGQWRESPRETADIGT